MTTRALFFSIRQIMLYSAPGKIDGDGFPSSFFSFIGDFDFFFIIGLYYLLRIITLFRFIKK